MSSGGSRSRNKGYRGENELVKLLRSYGIRAERVPLSGAVGGKYSGDVILEYKGRELVGEVKRRERGFVSLYKWLDQKDILFLRSNRREWLVVMRLGDLLEVEDAS